MKKITLVAALAMSMVAANAQTTVEGSKFFDNWSLGLKGGAITPLHGHSFFQNMRGVAGLELRKQITPVFGLGVEGEWMINTSTWNEGASLKNAFDMSYVGAFGAVNLNNLFAGYAGTPRLFEVEAVLGAGWLHWYAPKSQENDWNSFGTKAGLNLNFNLGEAKAWTVSLKPAVLWNMTPGEVHGQSLTYYNGDAAAFEFEAGVTYHFGNSNGTHSFVLARLYDQAEIDALNGQINALRAEVAGLAASNAACEAQNADLAAKLQECLNRPAQVEVVKEESNTLSSVRYVFFKIGSSTITADQQPNVEMIAAYLKNHPDSKVVVKGYASQDGNIDFNTKLAAARAESVKKSLISKYKISADRITAEGEGIGHMFTEDSWNRVSICVIED